MHKQGFHLIKIFQLFSVEIITCYRLLCWYSPPWAHDDDEKFFKKKLELFPSDFSESTIISMILWVPFIHIFSNNSIAFFFYYSTYIRLRAQRGEMWKSLLFACTHLWSSVVYLSSANIETNELLLVIHACSRHSTVIN